MKYLSGIALFLTSLSLDAQQTIQFEVAVAEETSTQKVYDFIVDDFDNIVSLQYSMLFDEDKMQFAGIRNEAIPFLTQKNFNVYQPGVMLSLWYSYTLETIDMPNPAVIFQLVFDLSEPGGSTLCFSPAPLVYEIGFDGGEVGQLIVTDDCNEGLVLDLTTTAVEDPALENNSVYDLYLSKSGQLDLSVVTDMQMGFTLIDLSGRELATSANQLYTAGRQSVHFGKELIEGIYILQIDRAGHSDSSVMILVK